MDGHEHTTGQRAGERMEMRSLVSWAEEQTLAPAQLLLQGGLHAMQERAGPNLNSWGPTDRRDLSCMLVVAGMCALPPVDLLQQILPPAYEILVRKL